MSLKFAFTVVFKYKTIQPFVFNLILFHHNIFLTPCKNILICFKIHLIFESRYKPDWRLAAIKV